MEKQIKIIKKYHKKKPFVIPGVALGIILLLTYFLYQFHQQTVVQSAQLARLMQQKATLSKQFTGVQKDLADLKNQDQYKINQNLQAEVKNIHDTYKQSVATYEKLLDYKQTGSKTGDMDTEFAEAVNDLSEQKYASASAVLNTLNSQIQTELDKIAAASAPQVSVAPNAPANNAAPGSGFSRQSVTSDTGTFTVDIIAADLNSTKVIIDTASDGDCANNCPVMPLANYVSRSGAYAGINGSFFCPASYPSCAGKTNSFDTLLMNKNKVYFNSANNVYSTVPAVIFSGNSARFVGQSLQWGRDTGVDAVIAMQPMLVSGGSVVYDSSSDGKFNSKGPRGFIGATGSTAYIGFVYNADMRDSAHVLKTMGIQNAINLDEGGSTALWFGGYKAGPGRDIPNAVLFVHR